MKAASPSLEPDEELDGFPAPDEASPLTLIPSETGERLDKWLAAQMPDRSRSEVQRWIDAGLVELQGKTLKASHRVSAGDEISLLVPPMADYEIEPEALPLTIIYEDRDLLVIDKPAGMVVHPATGNWHGTLVNAVLYHAPSLEGVGGVRRPGIVHRLDRDTSGLIVVAKNDATQRALQDQFKEREVRKTYLALVHGRVSPPEGMIDAPIGRNPRDRKRMAVLRVGEGRPAQTRYESVAFYRSSAVPKSGDAQYTLLRCYPLTGRTHQIRVHLAHIGHPIASDAVYATRRRLPSPSPRQFLHAHQLRFRLPATGEEAEFTSALPADLAEVLGRLYREEELADDVMRSV
jgi:23S rRNA pseudouridine1911/1915/1917 synthase